MQGRGYRWTGGVQEFKKALVERAVEGLPAHLALAGDGGDDRKAVALVVHRIWASGPGARSCVLARRAPAGRSCRPMGLGPFDLGTRGDP